MTMSTGMEASGIGTTSQEGSKEFLPGIPDEITLRHVVPKLPWEVVLTLSSVSRAWLQGIRTRQVYDARILSHSSETFAFVRFFRPGAELNLAVGFCSLKENQKGSKPKYLDIHPPCAGLPPIPYRGGQWACSDGYMYLLAAQMEDNDNVCSSKVFVVDVAGQRQWKECSSMNERRRRFGCGVMHGKLYVFGGLSTDASFHDSPRFCGSEVYDPKEDRWSPIKPMKTSRWDLQVETVGHEFFLYGGEFLDPIGDGLNSRNSFNPKSAKFLEIYHPVNDEWIIVNPFWRDTQGEAGGLLKDCLFAGGGKLYSINWSSIHVYEGGSSWKRLHSYSFPLTAEDSVVLQVSTAVVVDNELLVQAWLAADNGGMGGSGTFQSTGFGGDNKEIMWQETRIFEIIDSSFPHSSKELIQL